MEPGDLARPEDREPDRHPFGMQDDLDRVELAGPELPEQVAALLERREALDDPPDVDRAGGEGIGRLLELLAEAVGAAKRSAPG